MKRTPSSEIHAPVKKGVVEIPADFRPSDVKACVSLCQKPHTPRKMAAELRKLTLLRYGHLRKLRNKTAEMTKTVPIISTVVNVDGIARAFDLCTIASLKFPFLAHVLRLLRVTFGRFGDFLQLCLLLSVRNGVYILLQGRPRYIGDEIYRRHCLRISRTRRRGVCSNLKQFRARGRYTRRMVTDIIPTKC